MVEEFKFYIDKQPVVENPLGWESLVTTVRMDRELKGLFTVIDVTLTFFADGYQMIKTADETFGYCHQMDIEIRQWSDASDAYIPIYTGLLFLKDCEFQVGVENEREVGSVKIQIQDNSFFARIKNNRNLKAKIYVGKSKNNVDITPCPYQKIQYFNCPTGGAISILGGAGNERNNTAFRVWDVLKYLVDYMSDGEMDFYSDAFDDTGIYGNYLISNGFLARFVMGGSVSQSLFEDNWKEMCFADVFKELDREFNICFVAGFDGGRPYLRIEENAYLTPDVIRETLDSVGVVKRKCATEYLYDKVILGCEITTDEPTLTSGPAGRRLTWFTREEYVIAGTCNNERSLDLTNQWVIDSNTIEMLVEYGLSSAPTTYDDVFSLIKCTFSSGTTWIADQSNWITGASTPVFYNESLNSNNKTQRYLGGIPNSIILQLSSADNKFEAESPTRYDEFLSNPGVFNPADFSIEITDPGNNYDPAGYFYRAPNTGVYTFQYTGRYTSLAGPSGCQPHFDVFIETYATGDTPGVDPPLTSQNISPFTVPVFTLNCVNVPFIMSGSVNMTATDKAVLHIVTYLGNIIFEGSRFSCIATAADGGIYKTYDPTKYPIHRHTINKYPYTLDDFLSYQLNQRGLVAYGVAWENYKYAHLEELKFHNALKVSDWTLISNENLNQ